MKRLIPTQPRSLTLGQYDPDVSARGREREMRHLYANFGYYGDPVFQRGIIALSAAYIRQRDIARCSEPLSQHDTFIRRQRSRGKLMTYRLHVTV